MPVKTAFAVALLLLCACGGSPSGPTATVDQYRQALTKKDFARAYGLLSEATRARYGSREAFIEMMEKNQKDVRHTANELKLDDSEVTLSATFEFGAQGGVREKMQLVYEEGSWRIDSNPINFYGQDSPRQTLRSFIRAYRLKRWATILRFVPKLYAKKMDAKAVERQFAGPDAAGVEEMIDQIAANLQGESRIVERGERASLLYDEQNSVELIFEDGAWKILDFQ